MKDSTLHPELSSEQWKYWGDDLRDRSGAAQLDRQLFIKRELLELLHFARSVATFNIAPMLRSALFVPFDVGWNRYVNLVALEIEAMHNRMLGEPSASDDELAHQWELSGLKRP